MAESHREEIAKLEALYASNPGGRVFVHLAEAHRKAGQYEHARAILEEGLGRHADSATGHVVLGRVLTDLGLDDEAEAAFRRVLELDSGNLVALRGLAELARAAGRLDEAVAHYREVLSRNPSQEEVQRLLAEVEAELGASSGQLSVPAGVADDETAGEADTAWSAGADEDAAEQDDSAYRAAAGAAATGGEVDEAPGGLAAVYEGVADATDQPAAAVELVEESSDLAATMEELAGSGDERPGAAELAAASTGQGEHGGLLDIGDFEEAWAPGLDAADYAEAPLAAAPGDAGAAEPAEAGYLVLDLEDLGSAAQAADSLVDADEADLALAGSMDQAGEAAAAEPVARGADSADARATVWDGSAPWDDAGVMTETIADLYRQQGLLDRAADVYRALLQERPDDERLAAKLSDVEQRPGPGAADEDDAAGLWVDAAGAGPAAHTSPYAWAEDTDAAADTAATGMAIGSYLLGLASWRGGSAAAAARAEDDAADEAPGADEQEMAPLPRDEHGPLMHEAEPILPTPPAAVPPAAASGQDAVEAAFEEWYGNAEPVEAEPPPGHAEHDGSASGEEAEDDEDLAMFRSWLQSLKQ
jgi:tetratricopeptide (TPR) repeat protein